MYACFTYLGFSNELDLKADVFSVKREAHTGKIPDRATCQSQRMDMTDRQANTDEETKTMDKDKSCKPTTGKKAVKKGDGIPDPVKGMVAVTAKRPEMNDPTHVRTESDEEDMDPDDDWKPPSKEEEEQARRGK